MHAMAQLQGWNSRETKSRCIGEEGKGGLFKLANVPPTMSLGRQKLQNAFMETKAPLNSKQGTAPLI